jgi:transcriptional regulator with XRE-family HTH domain
LTAGSWIPDHDRVGRSDALKGAKVLRNMGTPVTERQHILREISENVRYFRLQQGLTMEALAKKAGFTKSYVSQIEAMKREPTIGTLVTIAHALSLSVFSLIGGEDLQEELAPSIVRKNERRRAAVLTEVTENTLDAINYRKKNRLIDAYILTSSSEFSEKPRSHQGEELFLVLNGRMELLYDGKSYILEEGDCCYFDSSKPHSGRSIVDQPSEALLVFSVKP